MNSRAMFFNVWPSAHQAIASVDEKFLSTFPVDHSVPPSPIRGGERAARSAMQRFLDEGLHRYVNCRNHPDDDVTSGLSPYLHFGHISVHQVFDELITRGGLVTRRTSGKAAEDNGKDGGT